MLLWILVAAGTVALDQLTKYLASTCLKPVGTVPIIRDALHLTYSENTGAAFGMLKNSRWVFLVFSCVAIAGILAYLIKAKPKHPLLRIALALILGGGIGNMIDRIFNGYVVDFIDFRLINFAVFNGADSCITVGAVLLFIYLLFLDRPGASRKKGKAEPAADAGEEPAEKE